MTRAQIRPAETEALTEALAANGKVRITLRELWTLWAAAAPRLNGDPAQAAALAAALTQLADQDVIVLPSGAWDTSTTPPLPRSITVPRARQTVRPRQWTRFPWCAELGWVASLPSLSDSLFNDLVAINDWLAQTRNRQEPVLPMRYRSVQLFGDEKRLEAIARTNLFGDNRLSLEKLACVRIPPPLAAAAIGTGPDLLVIENSDTYWAAVDVLTSAATHPIGLVAWGAGRSFPSQIPTLSVDVAGRGPVKGIVWYWGDMDPDGLRIATSAASLTTDSSPPIRPAYELWAAMAERPVQERGAIAWHGAPGLDWLGPDLWTSLAVVRSADGRVAQESVAPTAIADWATGLRSG